MSRSIDEPDIGKETPIARKAAVSAKRRGRSTSFSIDWTNIASQLASPEFAQGPVQLLMLASSARIAIMCAEAVWWRCHRSMIADALCVRGIEVMHILGSRHETLHPMTSPARVVRGRLSYALP
jgi:hypothetical protein